MTNPAQSGKHKVCAAIFLLLGYGPLVASAWATEPPVHELAPTVLTRVQDFSHQASKVATSALGMLGVQYKHGGNTREDGLDCSGFVRYVFMDAWGKVLPRTAEEISQVGLKIEFNELQPGDLVFYNTLKRSFSHVGIYLGDNKFIHSPSAGGEVRIEKMNIAYWNNRFNGARRISNNDPN